GRDRDARVARPVRVRRRAVGAVERFREDACERGLAGSAWACEEVGLAHVAGRDRVPQRADDGLLSDHVVEPRRTIFAGGRGQERCADSIRGPRPEREDGSVSAGVDVPVQFFQSVIAIELAVTGALLWQIRYFESKDAQRRDADPLPDPRLRLGLALVLG